MNTAAQSLTVLVTGASGGIGRAIAELLAARGHRLLLQGRDEKRLQQLCESLPGEAEHRVLVADLLDPDARQGLVQACRQQAGGVDVLINNAGVSTFALLADTRDDELVRILNTNLLAPMALTRDLMPVLQNSRRAAVINIGSAFGHIGHPGFSVYGASKSGLHGFTEALRREVADSGVRVHYLAPRAVDTAFNSDSVNALNRSLGNKSDSPQRVALACLNLLEGSGSRRRFIGWPERLFIKVNAIFPALVDSALAKKLPVIREYAQQNFPDLKGETP
ncbi:SDR family oxidoreductase [Microbulbifer hydrolyticus]|uniref:SDR family oxidoreductase n=1 Tax=Microbulbifer hydrolyticus TaxID=48074 RepID=A0A6P1TE07_9GAMM|nr:SDR family oxidoreductase [Microbulbifer hydrolyticus]MBB5212646.1 short-subunit dehydrogenase [Microbulbifer hydrolyticus]QHQ40247.1 SDR family oxidoreductase [Microbulbifer hydrolyticus]